MVREALFNMLQGASGNAGVLDLFAGSGALGFEALSRGAAAVTFCDTAPGAMAVVRRNAALLSAQDRCTFLQLDWCQALHKLGGQGERFDLIFLDPPYGMDLAPVLLEILAQGTLNPGGQAVVEHGSREEISLPAGFDTLRSRRYGESAITLITLTMEEDRA
jgi:16S rRNA (guanine966-N2)-methyltransferase